MTIDFSENTWYEIYCKKRESLPLYYYHGMQVIFEKGMYRCEEEDEYNVRVYNTPKGTVISKFLFNSYFKKPSKIQLFIYNYLYFLWL